jgi:biotin operon repressor
VVTEAEGMMAAQYTLRVLLSEHHLSYYTVEKDKGTNHQHTVVVHKDGPTGFITTTTLSTLHPENETRLFSLTLDESTEQTRRIMESTAACYAGGCERRIDLETFRAAQQMLEPVRVCIPYAGYLAQRIPARPIRMRRDFSRILAAIEACAVLHQHQRHHREQNGADVIEADLRDYFIVKTLFESAFRRAITGEQPQVRQLVRELASLSAKRNGDWVGARDLRDALGLSKATCWRRIQVAQEAGLIEERDDGIGKPKGYRLAGQHSSEDAQTFLPTVEAVAEQFPDLATRFEAVDPVTGEAIALLNEVTATA